MSEIKSKYKDLLKLLASPVLYENVKSFIATLYDQLGNVQSSSLKAEHQEEFINLRSQFRNLINQTRGFCDKAIPCIEYTLKQFKSNDSQITIDCKELAVQLLSIIDPTPILDQCQLLEDKICLFIDRINMDSYYKTSNLTSILCIAGGAAAAIASLCSLAIIPFVVEMELLLLSPLIAGSAVSSINLMAQGWTKIQSDKDLQQYKLEINKAKDVIYQLKLKLSDVTKSHAAVQFQLKFEDIQDLQPIYENLLNNIQEIRVLCCKPFPN